jgi:hypothetical protein
MGLIPDKGLKRFSSPQHPESLLFPVNDKIKISVTFTYTGSHTNMNQQIGSCTPRLVRTAQLVHNAHASNPCTRPSAWNDLTQFISLPRSLSLSLSLSLYIYIYILVLLFRTARRVYVVPNKPTLSAQNISRCAIYVAGFKIISRCGNRPAACRAIAYWICVFVQRSWT